MSEAKAGKLYYSVYTVRLVNMRRRENVYILHKHINSSTKITFILIDYIEHTYMEWWTNKINVIKYGRCWWCQLLLLHLHILKVETHRLSTIWYINRFVVITCFSDTLWIKFLANNDVVVKWMKWHHIRKCV